MSGSAPRYTAPLLFALLICAGLGAANLVMGELNQDEGWYLYAALSTAEGQLPYRDFAFTQGPMLPLVYGLFSPVIHSLGVGGGRALTWVLGFGTALLAFGAGRRLGGRAAGTAAFVLIALNVYQSYFTTVVKTYALCSLFMMFGFYAMSRFIGRRHGIWLAAAGAGLALAAGTRLSSGILLPLAGLWMLLQPRRWGRYGWVWFGAGGGLTLLAVFLPLYLAAPDGFMFGLIEYHTLREGGGFLSSMVLKAGFVSRLVQAYFAAAALLVLMAAAKRFRPFKCEDTGYHQSDAFFLVRLLWVSAAAVTLVHIAAPFPYDDYQVPVYPVFALALGVSWAYAVRAWTNNGFRWREGVEPSDPPGMRWFVWGVTLICAAGSFSSPINMDWMIAGRDRIWWIMKEKPALMQLRDAARIIREMDDGGTLLTQDTYLAVEAGRKVPPGWEMGPFSYYPAMSDDRAAGLHLVNHRMLLRDLLEYPAGAAAFSGYSLSIASPRIEPLSEALRLELEDAVAARFDLVDTIERFGQAGTSLRLYRAKSGSPEDAPR